MHFRRLLSPIVFVPVLAVAAIAGGVFLASTMTEDPAESTAALYDRGDDVTTTSTSADAAPTEAATTPADAPREGPAILLADVARMRIERLGVDADLVKLGILPTGYMDAPNGPDLVGWYHFTGRPGAGTGNAVFAGHRDWRDHGLAVFGELEQLARGDTIEVELRDGYVVRYTVTAAHTYSVQDLDMREILARTEEETITLITCAGAFEANDYTDRHIVRAVRSEAVPAQASAR